jgi:hypothetical protein
VRVSVCRAGVKRRAAQGRKLTPALDQHRRAARIRVALAGCHFRFHGCAGLDQLLAAHPAFQRAAAKPMAKKGYTSSTTTSSSRSTP